MYKIVGADRREYGPVTKEAVLEWIAQGRANAQTIARFEDGAWKPLATFDEFKPALSTAPGAGAPTASNPTGSATPPFPGAAASTTAPPLAPIAPIASGTARGANNMAIAALVFSILGLLCCPCLGPTLGIILGFISLGDIKQNPQRYSTDETLPKIAIGIGIFGVLIHCGLPIFSSTVKHMLHSSFRF